MSLFVMDISYTAELSLIDEAMGEHREWLVRCYDEGKLLASGRKEPRTGGVLLARLASRQEAEELAAGDPFSRKHLAAYTITEFLPTMTSPELESFRKVL